MYMNTSGYSLRCILYCVYYMNSPCTELVYTVTQGRTETYTGRDSFPLHEGFT